MDKIHLKLSEKYPQYANWHSDSRHVYLHWGILVVSSVFFSSLVLLNILSYSNTIQASSSESVYNSVSRRSFEELSIKTDNIIKLAKAYNNSSDKKLSIIELKKYIEERNNNLLEIIKNNAKEAKLVMLNDEILMDFPEEVRALLEQKVSLEGNLIVSHQDYDDDVKRQTTQFYIETPTGKNIRIYPSENSAFSGLDFKPKKVRVSGTLIGDAIVADTTTETSSMVNTAASVSTSAIVQKVAIILFNWQNDTTQPLSVDQARIGYFTSSGSTADYHEENSYGKILIQGKNRVDGDVVGYYTIPYSSGTCGDYTNVWAWGDAAIAAAQNAGNDLSGYSLVTFVFPKNAACGWAGYAISRPGKFVPLRNFINGASYFRTSVNAHEVGHILGSHPHHAASYRCTDVNGVPAAIGPKEKCSIAAEYGDPFDIMGNSGLNSHMNGPHKAKLNVLSTTNLQLINTSGVYKIAPIEIDTGELQVIKIPRAKVGSTVYDYLYLTFRQPIGFDSNLSTYSVVAGVSIHIGECASPYVTCVYDSSNTYTSNISMLLDNTPGDNNWRNSALIVGQTFTDPLFGITVKTLSVDQTGATVEITTTAPACVRSNPTVTISPSSQWVYAGYPVNYTVAVRNNNNEGCSPTTYNIISSIPSGWTQPPVSISSLASGASASASVVVTSPVTALVGTYQITQRAIDSSDVVYSGSSTATYSIMTQDLTSPVVSIASPLSGATLPSKGKVDISASASDSSGVASINIYIDNSFVKGCVNTTICSYSWTMNNKLSKGSHTIKVLSTDKSPSSNAGEKIITVTK